MRILPDADFIDSMDDTVKSCLQNALGKLNPYKYFLPAGQRRFRRQYLVINPYECKQRHLH